MGITVRSPSYAEWERILRSRRSAVSDFLTWAHSRERTPAQSLRLVNRPDIKRAREILARFEEDWWGVVVYSCFDSVNGTQAVADAFSKPISAQRAAAILGPMKFARGACNTTGLSLVTRGPRCHSLRLAATPQRFGTFSMT